MTLARLAAALLLVVIARSQEPIARVMFAGRPVPGAVAAATLGDRREMTTSDADGFVRFGGLDAGAWSVTIEMTGFEPLTVQIVIPAGGPLAEWTLRLRPIGAAAAPVAPPRPRPAVVVTDPPDDHPAADGFLVNGSVNNAAASPFAQPRGFGNNRPQAGSLYTGNIGVAGGTSRWDARPYSFEGSRTAVPDHFDVQIQAALGGPIKPWFPGRTAPRFFAAYQGSTRQMATTESLLVPTDRERAGDFSHTLDASGNVVAVRDPLTGKSFADAAVPVGRLSPQAAALLALYPRPNRDTTGGPNLGAPVTTVRRQDDVQTRVTHAFPQNIFLGTFAWQRAGTRTRSAFGFDDEARSSGLDALASWNHRFSRLWAMRYRYQHTRTSTAMTPYFAGRVNISGDAGITGNDQSPDNWGPPRLVFPDIAPLGDATASSSKTVANGVNVETYLNLNRARHNLTIGADVRWQRQDVLSQRDARGTFTFTGAVTGVPFGDFLLGLPATSAIGFGNADKRFHSRSYAVYVSDDARIRPTITLTMGVRWEHDTPVVESRGRLANLDVAPGFTAIAPVTAASPTGPITGRTLPSSLVTSDFTGVQPRLALAWRPIPASPLTIRAGFGVYRNSGLHSSLAAMLAEQPPFARSAVVARSDTQPLTLASGFPTLANDTGGSFAIDPDVRVGSVRSWQLSAVRELPGSMQITASYLGSHGRRLLQQILPNSHPPGAANPCGECPTGFLYLSSTGRSARHALQLQLRRRLAGGLAASAQYTLAEAMDDAATFSGGLPAPGAIAQDWRDPHAEWAPSSFDQRHLFTTQVQYTVGGGRGREGWAGAMLRGWTIAGDLTAGSGLPQTPIVLLVIPGTGFVGARPDRTGAPIDGASDGRYANPAAFAQPAAGRWGTAARHSLRGPAQFRFDLSVARAFAWGDRRSVEWRVEATNVLNRVTFTSLHTIVGSPLFGLPSAASPMRKILTTMRVRF